jgi:hypothetical protein
MQEIHLGSSHTDTLSTKCGLAATYALQGRARDSKILLRQVNDQYQKILDDHHPYRVWITQALECLKEVESLTGADAASEQGKFALFGKLNEYFRQPIRVAGRKLELNDCKIYSEPELENAKSRDGLFYRQYLLQIAPKTNSNPGSDAGSICSAKNVEIGSLCGTPLNAACFAGNMEIIEKSLGPRCAWQHSWVIKLSLKCFYVPVLILMPRET